MYITAYTKTVKRRATGKLDTRHYLYRTKSLTDMHRQIRESYLGAETWHDAQIITDFIPGFTLWPNPWIVCGGERVA